MRQYASSPSHADPSFGSALRNVLPALWTAGAGERNFHGAINASNQLTSKKPQFYNSLHSRLPQRPPTFHNGTLAAVNCQAGESWRRIATNPAEPPRLKQSTPEVEV